MLFNIEINDQQVSARRGETILTVLNRNGFRVPTLCYLAKFSPTGSCRMCVVELEGMTELVPACSHPAEEWMKIRTHSPRVLKARKTLVELLLSSHPDDCLYCSRTGTCELQGLASELNVTERIYRPKRTLVQIDKSCPSIERDPAKCILCGRCIRVCDDIIQVSAIEIIGRGSKSRIGTSHNKGLNTKNCIKCGQCIMVCPTNALSERSAIRTVTEALQNKSLFPVVEISPVVAASIGEEFGIKSGKEIPELINTALKKIGFRQVFDMAFAEDLVITEMAAEFTERLSAGGPLPLFLSNCPSFNWYLETSRPGMVSKLSNVTSPQQVMGRIIKKFITRSSGVQPENIFVASVTPCTADKHEAGNDLIPGGKERYVDAVLTTRELVRLIRLLGIDFASLEPEPSETPFSLGSSSGKLAGITGGTLEGLLRTLVPLLNGVEGTIQKNNDLRGLKGIKESKLKAGKMALHVAAVSGLSNARSLLDQIEAGRNDLHIVEVMACPNGCINGGGQRIGSQEKNIKSRMKVLYDIDDEEMIRTAHRNPVAMDFYEKFLGKPFSKENREIFCTNRIQPVTP
ncbi:MAG: [Fe-Fe] hydrogenase large subunit C-terminal domain-containing protein [bacterium]